MKSENNDVYASPELKVHVLEPRAHARSHWTPCRIGHNVEFSTDKLESYCVATWEPVIYDALLVGSCCRICGPDVEASSPELAAEIPAVIPVHEPERWNDKLCLRRAARTLDFLTGDRWRIEFSERIAPLAEPKQQHFDLPSTVNAVIPFSDGMDSRCVAGLLDRTLGDRLIRVRLGSRNATERRCRDRDNRSRRSHTAYDPAAASNRARGRADSSSR